MGHWAQPEVPPTGARHRSGPHCVQAVPGVPRHGGVQLSVELVDARAQPLTPRQCALINLAQVARTVRSAMNRTRYNLIELQHTEVLNYGLR